MAEDPKPPKMPGEYAVGYGKPPKHSQFKKGAPSPNPGGRPRTQLREAQDVSALLNEPVPVKRGGKVQTMTTFEHNLHRLVVLAIKHKKLDAILEFLRLCEKHQVLVRPTARVRGGNLTFPKDLDYKAFCDWLDGPGKIEDPDRYFVVEREGQYWIDMVDDDERR